jgi:lipoic acid synthetase
MLRVRWLGRVPYREAHALQRGLHERSNEAYLLLLEHDHVYTLGVRADPAHVLVPPASVGADLVRTDRGGDVTYHGPGQLVGYPIRSVPMGPNATPDYVHGVEELLIVALGTLGLARAGRLAGYPGVWVDPESSPRKIAAIGVRITRGRSMHGFALNVAPDLGYFSHIVPCGISEYPVTSLAAEGIDVSLATVADAVVDAAARVWGETDVDRQDVSWRDRGAGRPPLPHDRVAAERAGAVVSVASPVRRNLARRLEQAGVAPEGGVALRARKPPWVRVQAELGPDYRALRRTLRRLELVTVCEEAGCPNIYECFAEGTATFMINGERCTRSCGFCLVDTRRPEPLDPEEPTRVADAVAALGLSHAVVTAVARDDLDDGGLGAFAATVAAIHRRCPATTVEVLVPDARGRFDAIDQLLAVRPDVVAHNLETVARLQRAVRPSADYARSLAVLAHARDAGLTTKSGLMVGLGETAEEVVAALVDLRSVGVDLVTIGQYLRPSASHLPVARWWTPEEIGQLGEEARRLGFLHVEASPLTRSSYHARRGAELAQAATAPT